MTPALLIEFDMRAGRRARRMVEIARIALRAGHSCTSAGAGILAIPRRVGMVFTYPASILAKDAGHRQTVLRGFISNFAMRRRPVFVVGAPRDDLERILQRGLIVADRIEIAPAAIIGAIIARRRWSVTGP
jgi:hypothetical protein